MGSFIFPRVQGHVREAPIWPPLTAPGPWIPGKIKWIHFALLLEKSVCLQNKLNLTTLSKKVPPRFYKQFYEPYFGLAKLTRVAQLAWASSDFCNIAPLADELHQVWQKQACLPALRIKRAPIPIHKGGFNRKLSTSHLSKGLFGC